MERTLHAKSGAELVIFHLGLRNVEGDVNTQQVLSGWRKKRLDAGCDFMTVMRGMACRTAVQDLQERGIFCRLVRVPGTDVWQYVRSEEGLPGLDPRVEVIETGDLKMVAALGVAGLGLMAITGAKGSRKYYVRRRGGNRMNGLPPVDGVELVRDWRKDKERVPWAEPFAKAARGLHNRERFLDAVNRERRLVLLQKPRSARRTSALVDEHAEDEAFDRVKDFFDRA